MYNFNIENESGKDIHYMCYLSETLYFIHLGLQVW